MLDQDRPRSSTGAAREEIVQRVRGMIKREQLRPGERLGSERGLCAALGVDRSPLRAALEVLERCGEIRRTMGRLGGVFVSDGKVTRHLNTIQGVPDMLRQQGLRHDTSLLRAEVGTPDRLECRQLRLAERDPVIRLTRRRDAAGVPLSLDSMAIPARLLPGWTRLDFSVSVYEILRREYGIEPARAAETIELGAATDAQARILQVPAGAPLFDIRRLTVDTADRPIELSRDLFRADRTRISLERLGTNWKRAVRPK